MNTVLFLTASNISGLNTFSQDLAKRQNTPITGKLLIIAGYTLNTQTVSDIANNLEHLYEVTEVSQVQVSETQSADVQLATMISIFFMQRYTSVPGPWLFIDSATDISSDDPITLLEKAHNANGTDNSGRASVQNKGRVPIGPVVIGGPIKKMSALRSISGESWRSRGRYVFQLATWYQVPADEYPFRLPASEDAQEQDGSHASSAPAPKTKTHIPVLNDGGQESPPVALSRNEKSKSSSGVGHAGIQTMAFDKISDGPVEDMINRLSDRYQPERVIFPSELDGGEDLLASTKEKGEAGEPTPGDPGFVPEDLEDIPVVDTHPASSPPVVETAETKILSEEIEARGVKKPFVRVDPDCYESVTHEVLKDQIAHRSGKMPHHRTGTANLIKKLKELDAATVPLS